MQGADKTLPKKGTKLSLSRKASKSELSSTSTNKGIQNLLRGNVHLNETCEFQDPLQFPGCGNNNAKLDIGKRGKAVALATKVSEKIDEESRESVRCHLCHKNISHMTVQRREQHVNKCIDQVEVIEKQQREEKKVLEAAKTAVLDCPMCGKQFKTENGRVVHLKKCCQEVGVSTEKMIQLVKDQEQERQKQVAAGIVPQQLRSKVTTLVAPKKRKLKEPKSQFEEDVQVAMAMSSSLSSSSTSDNMISAKRKKNKKTQLEDVCLLTTLTNEDRQKRIEEKVSNVLHMANSSYVSDDIVLQESRLKTDSLLENLSLWSKCSQDPITCDSEQFYVGALVPPLSVSKFKVGRNLRRLSSIPGRDNSLIKNERPLEKSGLSDQVPDDIITASTQTAVVLAELAVDDTDILDVTANSQLTQDIHKSDNLVELQASGFCVEAMVLNKGDQDEHLRQTLTDYKRMVNNKQCSDVTVTSCSGETFYAHQVILAARCPQLLQMMKDSIITLDFTPDIVLTFLTFIYTGDITLTPSSQTELLVLAKQLEFTPLVDACNKVVLQKEVSDTVNLNDNQESSETDFVESKLDMKEIWGESDSDLDQNEGDESSDKERSCDSDITEHDYRDISCTQHRKLKSKVSQSVTDIIELADDDDDVRGKYMDDELVKEGNISVQIENECASVENASSVENNDNEIMDVDLDIEMNLNEEDMNSDVSPSPKRARLSCETKHLNDEENAVMNQNSVLNKINNKDVYEGNTDHNGHKESLREVNKVIEIDDDIANDTSIGMNSSTADLFDSPPPKRGNVATETVIKEANKTLSSENDIRKIPKFSTQLENKFNTNTPPVTAVINIESDSTQEDNDNVDDVSDIDGNSQENNVNQCDNFNDSLEKGYDPVACDTETVKENEDTDGVNSYKMDDGIAHDDDYKSDGTLDGSDDDLQITGDNLDELIQNSPTFHHHKTIFGSTKGYCHGKGDLETKYLGLKSSTEVVSHRGSNSSADESVNIEPKQLFPSSRDSKDLHCEESNVNIKRPDSTDDTDESVTTVKQSSDKDYLDICSEESDMKSSPGVDVRKSVAYGKHEMSVYTDDADNAGTPNSSFNVDNADVWEDFDDCGMGYEPPDISVGLMCDNQPQDESPANNSALVECEKSTESADELSPVIPVQEVIDLSQNEDDNDVGEKQSGNDIDNALLEDGDDSFVFKVNDQQERKDTPVTKNHQTKKSSFKTPTVVAGNNEKKRQWEPPSPFTPMPEYGSMPTPALKKAVNKYGMKPVGKKRMIKVLEDIYHQTHQYETDSDCEEEVHTGTTTSVTGGGDTLTNDSLPSSQGDLSSQDSDISDVLEESCLHMSSDSDTSSSPQKNVDVTRQLFQFIKTRSEIHTRILMYEPLELDVLKKEVKDSGIKCSMDKLMDFLDERCIAFTSKNSRKRQTGRRGKQKTTKSKNTENQPDK